MDARGRQADHEIARLQPLARQQSPPLRRADREAREIEISLRVEARHFRGLAADQRAAGFDAGVGDALHYRGALGGIEPAGREIVEEEQRLGALDDDVVDAHRDEIDADRIENSALDRDSELGADPVVGRDQHGIDEARGLQVEQAAETADLGVRARPTRRAHQRLDRLDHGVSRIDIDAGIGVGERVGTGLAGHRLAREPRRG